jgi:RNA recognition motif-containing protein
VFFCPRLSWKVSDLNRLNLASAASPFPRVHLSRTKSNIISQKEEPHGSKLYVGGLPYSVTQDELTELFSAHGTVASANIISAKFTGQSRGFGFVEMSSQEEATAAIEALNSTEFGSRTLTVNEARPQAPRTGGGGGGGGGFDDKRRNRF